jgi:hypothetical protein
MKHTRFVHRLEREARLIGIMGAAAGEAPRDPTEGGRKELADRGNERPDGKKKESLGDMGTPELLLAAAIKRKDQKVDQASKDAKKEQDAVKTAQDFAAQVKASRMESNVKTKKPTTLTRSSTI